MATTKTIPYTIKDPIELNLSYMPFIENGGLFVPSFEPHTLGDSILIDLLLPGKKETVQIEGKIVWITPENALHHVLPGIGVQLTGSNAQTIRNLIESSLDKSMEIGGYTYGITEETRKQK